MIFTQHSWTSDATIGRKFWESVHTAFAANRTAITAVEPTSPAWEQLHTTPDFSTVPTLKASSDNVDAGFWKCPWYTTDNPMVVSIKPKYVSSSGGYFNFIVQAGRGYTNGAFDELIGGFDVGVYQGNASPMVMSVAENGFCIIEMQNSSPQVFVFEGLRNLANKQLTGEASLVVANSSSTYSSKIRNDVFVTGGFVTLYIPKTGVASERTSPFLLCPDLPSANYLVPGQREMGGVQLYSPEQKMSNSVLIMHCPKGIASNGGSFSIAADDGSNQTLSYKTLTSGSKAYLGQNTDIQQFAILNGVS